MLPVATDAVNYALTGPETPTGRLLRQFWVPVALVDDVVPGRAKPLTIMNQRFTYYRGASGEPHLVGFYCAHRSTQLSTGWVEGEAIRCFYHGWKYGPDGECIEQPAEQDGFAAKVRIEGYRTRAYLGLVYAYLGDGEPPEFPRIPTLEEPGYRITRSFARRSNYFNGLENSCDQIHVHFAHRHSRYQDSGALRELPRIDAYETDYGILRDVAYSDGKHRIAHTIVPWTSLIAIYDKVAGWHQHLSHRVPLDDGNHVSFTVDLIELEGAELERYRRAADERAASLGNAMPYRDVVAGALDGSVDLHALERVDIVNLQDDVAISAQPPFGQRPSDRLGKSDVQIILLRKILARESRALERGEPLKRWTIPAALRGTGGT